MNRTPFVHIGILIAFLMNSLTPVSLHAQELVLPKPGVMVHLSPDFTPAHLRGLVIDKKDPFHIDFFVNKGDQSFSDEDKKKEYQDLVKYFLAALAVPDENQWVNLSPYEKNRIIADDFSKTTMGRDLLAMDYLLKQITASIIYPEDSIGKKFWTKVYAQAQKQFGTTNVPVNTFNKVWIVPEKAVVYEDAKTGRVYIVDSKLKVMLEEDYMSLQKHAVAAASSGSADTHALGSQIVREIVIPQLTTEVNEGKNFAKLRQMYSAMILATWYKRSMKNGILAKIYADKAKVKGIDQDPKSNQEIYQKYVQAFKKGVYNYIKEEKDPVTQEMIPRKYFSGGFQRTSLATAAMQILNNAPEGPKADVFANEAMMEHIEKFGVRLETLAGGQSAAAMKDPASIDSRESGASYAMSLIKSLFPGLSAAFVLMISGVVAPQKAKAFDSKVVDLMLGQSAYGGLHLGTEDLGLISERKLNTTISNSIKNKGFDKSSNLWKVLQDSGFDLKSPTPFTDMANDVKAVADPLIKKLKDGSILDEEKEQLLLLGNDYIHTFQMFIRTSGRYTSLQASAYLAIIQKEYNCDSMTALTILACIQAGLGDIVFAVTVKEMSDGTKLPVLTKDGKKVGHVEVVVLLHKTQGKFFYHDQGNNTDVPHKVEVYKEGKVFVIDGAAIGVQYDQGYHPWSVNDLEARYSFFGKLMELFRVNNAPNLSIDEKVKQLWQIRIEVRKMLQSNDVFFAALVDPNIAKNFSKIIKAIDELNASYEQAKKSNGIVKDYNIALTELNIELIKAISQDGQVGGKGLLEGLLEKVLAKKAHFEAIKDDLAKATGENVDKLLKPFADLEKTINAELTKNAGTAESSSEAINNWINQEYVTLKTNGKNLSREKIQDAINKARQYLKGTLDKQQVFGLTQVINLGNQLLHPEKVLHSGKGSKAMANPAIKLDQVGGIDFNSKNLDLQVNGSNASFDIPLDPAAWRGFNIQGLVPVILDIKPVSDWGSFK